MFLNLQSSTRVEDPRRISVRRIPRIPTILHLNSFYFTDDSDEDGPIQPPPPPRIGIYLKI